MSCLIWRHIFHESWENKSKFQVGGLRENGGFLFFLPKGALTHHPEGAVVFPAEIVRSARRMRLLRAASRQCHSACESCCHRLRRSQLFPFWKQLATCPHKPATGSFICGYDPKLDFGSFSLLRKRNRK